MFDCLFSVDQRDPYATVAGRHFNQVLKRYGSPVVILNLVKVSWRRIKGVLHVCVGACVDVSVYVCAL